MPAARKTAARKPAPRTAAKNPKPGAKKPAARAAPAVAKPVKEDKADKPKKAKLVRDSFTIPKAEYAVLEELKLRAAKLGKPLKKSELLRAGIKALAGMPDAGFLASAAAVPALKTGRPGNA